MKDAAKKQVPSDRFSVRNTTARAEADGAIEGLLPGTAKRIWRLIFSPRRRTLGATAHKPLPLISLVMEWN